MPRKPPAPPATGGPDDDDLNQLRNEYHALLLDLAHTPASTADRLKLAELIREAIADATGPDPPSGQAAGRAALRIQQQTPYKALGQRLAVAQRKHPPLWGAYVAALLLNPVVAAAAGYVGIAPPAAPPPQHQVVADTPWRRASYRSLPEPDLLRGLVGELSPQALRGLSDEQIATRTRSVQQLMTDVLLGGGEPTVISGSVTTIDGDVVEVTPISSGHTTAGPVIIGQGGKPFPVPGAPGTFAQAWALNPWTSGQTRIKAIPHTGAEDCGCFNCVNDRTGPEPEPQDAVPKTKLVRQQRVRQSRSKRSGKR